MWVLGLVVVSLMGALLGRLGQVQLGEAAGYQRAAAEANTRTVVEPALRGRILDRNGIPLADNGTQTVVTVDPKVLADSADHGRTLLTRTASALGLPFGQLWGRTHACGTRGAPPAPVCWDGSPYTPLELAVVADPRPALRLLERPDEFPGIAVGAIPVRAYPAQASANAAQVLGYLASPTAAEVHASKGTVTPLDLVGRAGLEEQYDVELRGTPGRTKVAVDPRGVVTRQLSRTPPVPGKDLVTNLDVRVQAAAEQGLRDAVANAHHRGWKADAGAAVVLDTSSGAVLAAASYPAYDPDIWAGGLSERELATLTGPSSGTPLVSRVTSSAFSPASTFKVVSLAAAVSAGNPLDGRYDCTSSSRIGDRTFRNYESRAYGPISLYKAIVVSCDTVFYDLAYRSWLAQGGLAATTDAHDPFVQMATTFGFGARTGVDLPGEQAGRVPGREWKRATWEAGREDTCRRARSGYPEVARTDRSRAAYLTALAVESCRTGYQLRAGDAANFAIGQGDTTVTPLQMARAYAAIANGGTLWTPQVARGVEVPGGTLQVVRPRAGGRVSFPPGTLAVLRHALTDVVSKGTASGAFAGFPLASFPIAGKTGTAESFGADDTAWFVAYAPANHPRYAVAAVVAHGGLGGASAAPVARRIFETLRTLPQP